MRQVPDFGDDRINASCAFCGAETDTRDHCPSRVFLDAPYPENLPVVPACQTCNAGFSLDEEYVACLVACTVAGTTSPSGVGREKVQRMLEAKPSLRQRIEFGRSEVQGATVFAPEQKRVDAVIEKLAKGHALFELHELCTEPPDILWAIPLISMDDAQRAAFDKPQENALWPEVGSRKMQRIVEGIDEDAMGWLTVQAGRYRYNVSGGHGVEVRIVLQEYLAAFACWGSG